MLTDADYQELKAQQHNLNNEGRAALREYELSNPQHLATGALGSSGVTKLRETEPEAKTLNVPELPPEAPVAKPVDKIQELSDQVNTPTPELDPTRDPYLPTASHLKVLDTPPEYVSKNPLAGLKHVALATLGDPLDGPSVGSYFEPSEKQFQADMEPVLEAKGIKPGTPEYSDAFAEYKDRKWAQAYQRAQENDTPLTRVDYVPRDGAWQKLQGVLQELPDLASTFAKGFASGRTLHATDLLATDADREQAERNPGMAMAGELVGSMNPRGPLAKITKGAGDLAAKFLPGGIGGRLIGGALSGAVAADTDLAAREGAEAARSELHGGTTENAKDAFLRNLMGSSLMGGGMGLGGQLVAEGANALQRNTVSTYPEVGQLRRGGGDTSAIFGVTPGKDIAANVEAAREPIPGENKPIPEGNPTEIAASKVQGPLADINAKAHADTHATIATEQQAAIDANPKLQERVPASNTAQAAVDWALSKLQPEAKAGYLPGITKLSNAEQLPGADLAEVQKIAPRLWKPRIVNAAEAQNVANRARGRAITLDEARKLGLDVGALAKEIGPETGVPLDAPPIPDEPVDVTKVLPRYPKEQLASQPVGAATPEQAEAIKRYTFGKRNPGDEQLIDSYLENAPASPIPHVYRGLVMPAEQASDFLANGVFDTGDSVTSVSADPITARSFVARNLNGQGDVGITLKLEHASAKNIAPFADPQVSVEKELLLPRNTRFEIVSKVKDPTNPGNWIVTAKEVPDDAGGGSTAEEVFGLPAEKPGSLTGPVRGPSPNRAKPPPAPEPGSDWYDPEEAKARFRFMYGDTPAQEQFKGPAPTPDDITPTRPSEYQPRPPREQWATPSSPSGPPSALRAPIPTPPSRGAGPAIGGVPESEYRVILEPRTFDAKTFEEILGDVDRKAKAGSATATPDPAWKQLQRAIRQDREQFGSDWTNLIAKHHEMLNDTEQRSYHAGINEKRPYKEMQGSSQQTMNGKLVGFPESSDAAKALRELAASDPAVAKDLEVLGGQNAYSKLRGMANPRIGETLGSGGLSGHLRGLGPSVRLRADAIARGVSAGPTGEPTVSPRLVAFVRSRQSKFLPGMSSMGAGSLGLKAGSVYNSTRDRGPGAKTLTPEETQYLQKLLEATSEAR